jgi:glutamyl/glutaminyl-tRNA synthetase
MSAYITRFNPTANGPLHVGHIYMALVNQAEARRSGGRFILRIEDNQPEWVWRIGGREKIMPLSIGIVEDLAWMGIVPDETERQSITQRDALDFIGLRLGDDIQGERKVFFAPIETPGLPLTAFPYAPHLTAEKVVLDALSGVNLLIRGVDLLSEHCLYAHFCDILGLQLPRCVYLPRLGLPEGGDVSKTSGRHQVAAYRVAGMDAGELLHELRRASLIDRGADFTLDNLRPAPVWTVNS